METGDAPAAPRGEDSEPESEARSHAPRSESSAPQRRDSYGAASPRDELETLARRLEASEHRSTLAITGIDQSVRGLIARLESAERASGEAVGQASESVSELHQAQSELARRLAQLESDTTAQDGLEAVKSLEDAVAKVAGHVHDRDQRATQRIGGVEENLSALDQRLGKTAEDLSRRLDAASDHAAMQARRATEELRQTVETQEAKTSDALASIEATIERINQRLTAAENLTDNAMRSLEGSFAHLDDRLRQAEEKTQELSASGIAERIDDKFETLGRELRDRIEQVRQETAETIEKTAAEDRLDRMERALAKSNKRTARTLTEIGEQIGAMGQAVDRRLSETENRLRDEFAQDRTVEKRLSEIESASSDAIRQVAQSVEKISERLAERIEASETRNAQTVNALGDEMAKLAQRLTPPAQKSEDDTLAQRLRESERRTQQMIRDAVAGVSAKLDAVRDESESTLSPVQSALANLAGRLEAIESGAEDADAPAARGQTAERPRAAGPAQPGRSSLPPAEDALSAFDADDDLFEDETKDSGDGESEPEEEVAIEPPPRPNPFTDAPAAEAMDDEDDWNSVSDLAVADTDWNRPLSRTLADEEKARKAADEDEDEDEPEAESAEPAPAPAPKPLGATADSNFLAAARTAARNTPDQTARTGARASVLEARRDERAAGGGRKVLVAAGVLAVLALGAAAALLFMDGLPFQQSGVRVAGELNDPGVNDVLNGASGEFAVVDGAQPATPPAILPPVEDSVAADMAAEDALTEEDAASAQIEEPASAPAAGETLAGDPAEGEAADSAEATATPEPVETAAAEPAAEPDPAPVQTAEAQTPPAEPVQSAPVQSAPVPQARFVAGGPAGGETQTAEARPGPQPAPVQPAPQPQAPAQSGGALEQAAEAGDPAAQLQLGEFALQSGDPSEGARLIQAAASQGLAPAQYRLGKLYETGGAGLPQDDALARQWTQRAATAGNRNAMHNLALMYAEGRGVAQDDQQAAEWFERAALLGATDSQFNLAVLYEQGRGVPMSLPDAYAWYRIAQRSGDREAGDRADLLAQQLPEGAAAEAQRVADAFTPRTPIADANTVTVR